MIYDAPKLSTVYVVKLPVLGLQRAFFLEKLRIFFRSEEIIRFTKKLGGCHHLSLVYSASKLSTVNVVKSPVLGLQRAPENSVLTPSVLVLYV